MSIAFKVYFQDLGIDVEYNLNNLTVRVGSVRQKILDILNGQPVIGSSNRDHAGCPEEEVQQEINRLEEGRRNRRLQHPINWKD